ncbi:MATE family multidrug resistance protein [Archangium gephyra]|uniref:Multidrug-efflux transporter n=1 Tax=Archangium gephyra TaxID=48 RepID=A0AAC8QJA4_9BACT|nr:MATE family efflux transporter [Archangium gephyra]AKJ08166.1 Multidrug and toxin extrusion [Archangium gephyra]REG29900.1 MATE family multidrug resistance protein [Archangium gephyra]
MSPAPLPKRSEEFRALWKLALPVAIAQGGQSMMSLVDTAVVSRAGTESLAAMGVATAIFFAVSALSMGLMMGMDPLMSQAFGARNATRARALLWQGSYLALFAGCVLAVPMVVVLPWLLPLFGVGAGELPLVQDYLNWRAPSLPLMLLFINTRSYLQAAALTRPLVVATVVANVFNLGADIVFVFGGEVLPAWCGPLRLIPAMGVKGSAIATLLCCVLQWALIAWAVRQIPVAGGMPSVRPVRADILQALRVGVPIGLHIAAEVGVFSLAGLLARRLGPESMSAHQIAISYASFSFTVALGIGNAGSVRVGWAVGARNTPLARMSGLMAFGSGAGFMSLCALVFALFPEPLAHLMGTPSEVMPMVVPVLMVCAVFQISDGVQGVGAGVLRGAGETRFTFLANLVGHYLVGLPLALLLGFGLKLGVVGIWWGLCAGLTAVALALFWRFERQSAGTFQPLEA